ncbi:hypothetical protein V6N13_060380 [Hibiscus sabdariffa]|uniref:Uncharacterized protein n=2 Tax=Hibiscus sabdariffa TaxID=183260 RepID=A0ABR2GAH1_9ROSI
MARPNQAAVQTFISITGASEVLPFQSLSVLCSLREYAGHLNTAVNAYFSEGDSSCRSVDDAMDIDDPIEVVPNDPLVTHPREVREAPIEVKNSSELTGHSSNAPAAEDVSETAQAHSPTSHETFIINEADEDSTVQPMQQNDNSNNRHVTPSTSAPAFDNLPDYGNDIEEQMIRAAIEASKRDVKEWSDAGPWHNMSHSEDAILEEAVSMSLKTVEQEKALGSRVPVLEHQK